MSTIALPGAATPRVLGRRVATVARVLFGAAPVLAGWPLGIMGSSFVINLLIFSVIRGAVENPVTGGVGSIFVMQAVVCWQLLHQYFSFAVSLNVTRRAYFGGVALVGLAQSVAFGVFLYVASLIERATSGWGVNLTFFAPLAVLRGPWYEAIAAYTVPMIVLSCLGLFLGSVTKRWGGAGIFVLSIIVILVFGGTAALITYADAWSGFATWVAARTWLPIIAGWSLIPGAVAATAAWLVIRRTVP